MSKDVKVTLIRSHIGQNPSMRGSLLGLGLKKREQTVVLKDTPEVRGMINKVSHLVRVEE